MAACHAQSRTHVPWRWLRPLLAATLVTAVLVTGVVGLAQPARAAGPVVGMGDHVPLFMRRAVPNVELLAELTED